MAQNNILSVADLDFDTIKSNLKDYMRAQSQFKDYDFEGSSLSVLIDLLAYNTHYNAFYANMIANEMFLDTAVFRESVVSKAKMIGYTPTSRKSAEVYVNLGVYIQKLCGTAPATIQLNSYAKFKSSVANKEYIFNTLEDHLLEHDITQDTPTGWYYKKNVIRLAEGTHLTYSYEVKQTTPWQSADTDTDHYIIPNNKIDTSTLKVTVQNSRTDLTSHVFTLASELQTITSSDRVYWLHEVEDGKYEVKFGDDSNIGVGVEIGNIITFDYIATNGADANGCKKFTVSSKSYTETSCPIVEDKSMIASPTNYRVLQLSQDYPSDFEYGETVFGELSGATGEVEEWNSNTKILKLVSVIGTFKLNETITGTTTGTTSQISMSSLEASKSFDGSERESIESIKDLAPKSYQSQNRCVTTDDFETILKKEFSNIRAIKVWGGDTMNPPVYGKVFIALRPHVGQILSNSTKEYIRTNILGRRGIITVQTEIVDPDYIYIVPSCNIKYNPPATTKSAETLITDTTLGILDYATVNLNDFTVPFYYTGLTNAISDIDDSILSNSVTIKLKKYFDSTFNVKVTNTEIKFSNPIKKNVTSDTGVYDVITSSKFTYLGISGCEFRVKETDFTILQVVKETNGTKLVVCGAEGVGTVDYDNGIIKINNFTTSATELENPDYPEFKGRIELIAEPVDNDLFAREHQILDILESDIKVTTTDIRTLI